MSAFYGANDAGMRNWFVGILWAVGSFLILYKGFRAAEDWLLNLAGGFAILTAMTPCGCWSGLSDDLPQQGALRVCRVVLRVHGGGLRVLRPRHDQPAA